MGLFGRGRGLFGGLDVDRLAVAQAFVNGDYGAAAQIAAQQRGEQAERARAAQDAQRRFHVAQALTGLGYAKEEIAAMDPEEADRLLAGHIRRRIRPVSPDAHERAAIPAPDPANPDEPIVVSGSRPRDPHDPRNWHRFGGFTPFGWGGFPGIPR